MNPIFAAAAELQTFCRDQGWRFCFIGGLAVQRWGEPRMTRDVDLTLLTGFGNEASFIDPLLAHYSPRRPDARELALRYRVLLLFSSAQGVPLDVSLGAMPFEEGAIARSTPFPVGGSVELLTCSAEDLVVFKAFAGRDRDWLDIQGILIRRAGKLDQRLIWRELRPLLELKDDQETEPRLRALFVKSG